MIKNLLINGDDFGLSEGQNLGIIKAYHDGILRSTTAMINMPDIYHGLQLAKDCPNLSIGIHLNITIGKSLVSKDNSFCDKNGYFYNRKHYPTRNPSANPDELYNEWKAQIEKFIEITGHKPTHIDSHHHVHLIPEHIDVTIRLANEYHLPIRQRNKIIDDQTYITINEDFYGDDISNELLINQLETEHEYLEIMCHPAYLDKRILDLSSYNISRVKELDVLTSPEIKQFIIDNNIKLINYYDIQKD